MAGGGKRAGNAFEDREVGFGERVVAFDGGFAEVRDINWAEVAGGVDGPGRARDTEGGFVVEW